MMLLLENGDCQLAQGFGGGPFWMALSDLEFCLDLIAYCDAEQSETKDQ